MDKKHRYCWMVVTRSADGYFAVEPHFNKTLSEILENERNESGCDVVTAEYWKLTEGENGPEVEIVAR